MQDMQFNITSAWRCLNSGLICKRHLSKYTKPLHLLWLWFDHIYKAIQSMNGAEKMQKNYTSNSFISFKYQGKDRFYFQMAHNILSSRHCTFFHLCLLQLFFLRHYILIINSQFHQLIFVSLGPLFKMPLEENLGWQLCKSLNLTKVIKITFFTNILNSQFSSAKYQSKFTMHVT